LSGGSFSLLYQMILFSGSGETSVLCLNLFLSGNGRFFRSQFKAVQAARGDRERINHTSGSASAGGSNCGSTAGLSVGPTLLPTSTFGSGVLVPEHPCASRINAA
jgi:hypothetical protein